MIEAVEEWDKEQIIEDDLYRRMDNLGVRRDKRVQSVASNINGDGRPGETGSHS